MPKYDKKENLNIIKGIMSKKWVNIEEKNITKWEKSYQEFFEEEKELINQEKYDN